MQWKDPELKVRRLTKSELISLGTGQDESLPDQWVSFCIDMHSKDARVNGETEQRLYALSAWRETSFFTNRERAALAWTEALTLITEGRAPDEVYAEVRKEFDEEDLVNLSLAIITINGWNRLAIGFRKIPGEYPPHKIG